MNEVYYNTVKQTCNIISSVLFTIIYYPQIKRLIKTNNTAAFSINYLKILLLGYFFYTVFLVMEKLYILLVSSILNILCIFYMYYKKKKNINQKKKIKEELHDKIKKEHNIIIIN